MGAVCACNRAGTAISSEHNSLAQVSRPMRVGNETAPTVGCEVPAVAHEQVPTVDSRSWDDNKRVQEARRARVQWLETLRRDCATEEEFQTARTQPIWTQLDSSSSCSSSSTLDGPSQADLQRIHEENRLYFQHLMNNEQHRDSRFPGQNFVLPPGFGGNWRDRYSGKFYVDFGGTLEVGQKIGGGGQADIHEAIFNGRVQQRFVLKVFRGGYLLKDLQRIWSKDIEHAFRGASRLDDEPKLPNGDLGEELGSHCHINYGTLLQDGRFAFVLQRCWGDLRKYIDFQIVQDKTHQSPPFPRSETLRIIEGITEGMLFLHHKGIIHKDLKAANCLLERIGTVEHGYFFQCLVADYESSAGVVGTGFWRAPEILFALRNRERDSKSFEEVWTKMGDVYSYAMTCYEVLTGCIPFEDRAANDYDGVIGGERPPLPDYVDFELQELLKRCWHPKPSMRPSFDEIWKDIQNMQISVFLSGYNLVAEPT